MSFMDAVMGAREKQRRENEAVLSDDEEVATFVVARSELFGTKELIEKEASLVKSKTLREEAMFRNRKAKTTQGGINRIG